MAKEWFFVLVLIMVQTVFALHVCPDSHETFSCDQCVRCGGSWCSVDQLKGDRCKYGGVNDNWCDATESLHVMNPNAHKGNLINPVYAERTLIVENYDLLPFSYNSAVERTVSVVIHNSTQTMEDINVAPLKTVCVDGVCKLYIGSTIGPEFCTGLGTNMEFIYATIKVDNISEEAVIKFHVPCACECSKIKVPKAPQCNYNGDLSCGACSCYAGWLGRNCSKSICDEQHRGDNGNCNNPMKNYEVCSGNGECGPCDTCICYTDRVGSQYFDPKTYCSDICWETSNACSQCLTNSTLGACATDNPDCNRITKLQYNKTIAAEKDEYKRDIWVNCKETFEVGKEECFVEYMAMKNADDSIHVMVVNSCNDHESGMIAGGGGASQSKVPVILGVLAAVAVVAAAAGAVLWHHYRIAPPMPSALPDYHNIDAEDCVGENPLYKSPTSTFTNPQFGKC